MGKLMGIQPTPTPQPFGRPIRVWIFYPIIRLNAWAGQLSLVGLVECQKWRDLQDSSREKKNHPFAGNQHQPYHGLLSRRAQLCNCGLGEWNF